MQRCSERQSNGTGQIRKRFTRLMLERCEDRTVPTTLMSPMIRDMDGGSFNPFGSPTVAGSGGLTPTQIRHAYGYDSILAGSIVGDGRGQTIAIVSAFDNPKFVDSTSPTYNTSDLHYFNTEFGLPNFNVAAPGFPIPTFKKVNQTGGTTYPAANGGWAAETALDVEWAHALAPYANILLVEATDNSSTNMFAAVNYAKSVAGVSVVSMSWGGGESPDNTSSNSVFSKTGVTFLAATGDTGAPGSYPAFSPNVVAVGGTTLVVSGAAGNYVSESGWSGSGGGISLYQPKPSYQSSVTQSATFRTIPDVALNANPSTGVAVYDSYNEGSAAPWIAVGGTSFSAPAWASLIAIANQARATGSMASLNGGGQTLPLLYDMASTNYHDITSGNNGYPAIAGYDLVTGRGTPYAGKIVHSLVDDQIPPTAAGTFANVSTTGATTYSFSITYSDNYLLDVSSFDNNDVRVTGPGGFDVPASLVSYTPSGNGSPRTATYKITPPGGSWDLADLGTYSVNVNASQVADAHVNYVAAGSVGTFKVDFGALTLIVSNINDSGAGSLRQAILTANSNALAVDTITFASGVFNSPQVIALASALSITDAVVIQGPGAGLVTISGGNLNRIAAVNISAGAKTASISGVTLANGKATDRGGALLNQNAALTLDNVALANNIAVIGGGAIYINGNSLASLTLTNATLSNNFVSAGAGGAIEAGIDVDVVIQNSTLSGNTTATTGGAISFYYNGSLSMTGCTLSGNSAGIAGGALSFNGAVRPAGFTVRNSTVAGNTGGNGGGGFYLYSMSGKAILQNCTIASNVVSAGSGGGIQLQLGTATASLESCVVAKNLAASAADLSSNTAVTLKNSLIGISNEGFALINNGGNLLGTKAAPLDPQLGALASNGGPTQTMAIIGTSPAYNAGTNPASLTTDQRGGANVRVFGAAPDMGAYEAQYAPAKVASIVVNDNSAQRSMVRSMTVTFDSLVTLPINQADAFSLACTFPTSGSVVLNVDTSLSGATTVAKLTFQSGPLTNYSSLADGLYTLTVLGAQVFGPGGLSLDGDGNGTLGGNAVLNTHRLFGDVDGDRSVSGADFNQFRTSFGGTNSAFDFDDDGAVAASDFSRFRTGFGGSI